MTGGSTEELKPRTNTDATDRAAQPAKSKSGALGMTMPDDVLTFWFAGDPSAWRAVWFETDATFDAACGDLAAARSLAKSGALDAWVDTPRGGLALLILLDQLSRNLHRGTAEAFAADAKARAIARIMLARGFDQSLTPIERMFVYLPFEHSEDMTDQDLSVRLFEALDASLTEKTTDYAVRHRDVIRRFGRFPHRNAALGRPNTADEDAFLAEPGAGF
jgi:uncharacterized protein (DUF924 family)